MRQITDSPTISLERPEYATCKCNMTFQYKTLLTASADVANANTLWARIEACSSILAACLPTLAPLASGVYLQGLISNWQSKLSWFSSLTAQSSKGWGSTGKDFSSNSTASDKEWQEARTGYTFAATGDVELGDVPRNLKDGKGIVVQHSFRSNYEDRRV